MHRLYDNVCDFCVFCSNRFARNLTELFQITHNILLKDLFESVLFLSEGHCGLSELPFDFALWAKIKDQCSQLLSISVAERSRSKPKCRCYSHKHPITAINVISVSFNISYHEK